MLGSVGSATGGFASTVELVRVECVMACQSEWYLNGQPNGHLNGHLDERIMV